MNKEGPTKKKGREGSNLINDGGMVIVLIEAVIRL